MNVWQNKCGVKITRKRNNGATEAAPFILFNHGDHNRVYHDDHHGGHPCDRRGGHRVYHDDYLYGHRGDHGANCLYDYGVDCVRTSR